MDQRYWDDNADLYEETTLSVFKHDRNKQIRSLVRDHVSSDSHVADFGCGIGYGIRLLSAEAKHVYAIDLSENNLERARARCRGVSNVTFHHCDLAREVPDMPKLDFAVSVNSLIAPDSRIRKAMLANIVASMRPGAVVLIVVPSTESNLWTYRRLFELELKRRKGRTVALAKIDKIIDAELNCITQGIFELEGVETKFYLGPELDVWLLDNGISSVERIALEYGWEAEVENPPKWLLSPRPWHWLVIARLPGS